MVKPASDGHNGPMHTATPAAADPPDPRLGALLDECRQRPLWLFAYGSLVWKRGFPVSEERLARVHGWHRHFRMRSRVNRGTVEQPGLVLGLSPGGCCRGLVLRVPHEQAVPTLQALWLREMPTGSYTPRWLRCETAGGGVSALAFTLDRHHPAHLGALDDERLLHILRHAQGRYGRTLDYLLQTEEALRAHGIPDHGLARQVRLARRHGLC